MELKLSRLLAYLNKIYEEYGDMPVLANGKDEEGYVSGLYVNIDKAYLDGTDKELVIDVDLETEDIPVFSACEFNKDACREIEL